jgi:hypothetical protein
MGTFFGGFVGSEQLLDGCVTAAKIYPQAINYSKINGNWIKEDTATTDASGNATVTFPAAFQNTPTVLCFAHIEGWVVQATSVSTTGFVAKAKRITSMSGSVSGTSGTGSAHAHTITLSNNDGNSTDGLKYYTYAGYNNAMTRDTTMQGTITGVTGIQNESSHTHTEGSLTASTSGVAGAVTFFWHAEDVSYQ